MMQIDIRAVRKKLGLSVHELSALLGSCHTTLLKIEERGLHRNNTAALYVLLGNGARRNVTTLLRWWLRQKPAPQHVRPLLQVAQKWHPRFSYWREAFYAAYPEYRDTVAQYR